jgi:8-oxo-(d)GTP phosphatase
MAATRTAARTVHAAGAVLWRAAAGPDGAASGVEVAVVHRPHHGDWSLPKGKVDPGETRAQAAVREIAEETGYASVLSRHLATVRYTVGDAPKEVDFWNAAAGAGAFTPGDETDELRWLAPADATALLTYDSDREVLAEFVSCPPRLATAVLVRHAKAGSRADWEGPDERRPLTGEGRAQANRIGAQLGYFGVGALHAATRLRCEETLAPAAHRMGLDVLAEPGFTDEAVEADPGAAVARLAQLAARGPVPAVCAQGDGIPMLVRHLAQGRTVRSNRRLDDPPCRKGSLWVLSFLDLGADAGGLTELVAADYYRDATF